MEFCFWAVFLYLCLSLKVGRGRYTDVILIFQFGFEKDHMNPVFTNLSAFERSRHFNADRNILVLRSTHNFLKKGKF